MDVGGAVDVESDRLSINKITVNERQDIILRLSTGKKRDIVADVVMVHFEVALEVRNRVAKRKGVGAEDCLTMDKSSL